MKDKQSHLMILIAAGALLVLTAGGSWIHWQLVSTQATALAAINNQCRTLQNTIDKSTIHEKYDVLQKQAQLYDQALPVRNEVAVILEDLSNELLELGVSERSVVTGATTRTGMIHQIPVYVNFKGSFPAAFNLLAHLQKSSRLIRIERLEIQRDLANASDQLAITANLRSFGRALENNHE